jgi:hypothetical protein
MDDPFPVGWHQVVREHFSRTAGYVVAQSGACLDIQSQERKHPKGRVRGRDFQPLTPEALKTLESPGSWFMGIILCPGDNVEPYAKWSAGLDARDRDRIVFFAHPDVSADEIDDAWSRATGSHPQIVPLPKSWAAFHHTYGRLHGDRVFLDHASPKRKAVR